MAAKFGNTWWGEAWLQALSHIDYSNRIPRGARYARNGSVKNISIKGNVVEAKVAGSRPRPYNVRIEIPLFSKKDTSKLMDALMKRPSLIAQLLNRELDPSVLRVAELCGLSIFPRRWNDLMMSCSCPDWAVPCKHLAAVIYMMSREIDNNPFLAFEMHGVNLLAELEQRGIKAGEKSLNVNDINDVLTVSTDLEEASAPHRINFAHMADRTEALLLLLPDNPPFCPEGNFKNTYAAEMRRIAKNANRLLSDKTTAKKLFGEDGANGVITTTTNLSFTYDTLLRCKHSFAGSLPLALLNINPDFLPDYEPSVIAAHQALLLAMHLVSKGCAVPQIVRLSDNKYSIYWRPAYIDQNITAMMQSLGAMMPATMMNMVPTGKKRAKPLNDKADWLITYFLNLLVSILSGNTDKSTLHQLFFKGASAAFSDIGEKERAGAIMAWTDHNQLTASNYLPVFSVDETSRGFTLSIGVNDTQQPDSPTTALSEILSNERYSAERFDILRSFSMLSTLMKEVKQYINDGAQKPIYYRASDFAPFLLNVIPAVRLLGIKVFLPKSLSTLLRPKASIRVSSRQSDDKSTFGLFDLFNFQWQVALGDNIVSREEFEQLQVKANGLIRYKKQYIYADEDDLRRLNEALSKSDNLSPVEVFKAAISGEYQSAPVTLTPEARILMDKLTKEDSIDIPSGLNATLRPYQERGFSWMYRNMKLGFGSILADDMGLGKTLQSITLMLKLKEEGALNKAHILVVAPTGLLANWAAELQRFAPTLSVFIYHGGTRDIKLFDHDVMVTSYGVLRTDNTKLKKVKWRLMFIDEAQNIKNRETAQAKAANAINAEAHIALSGTPVENRLSEFWSIMDYANKGYLGTPKRFNEEYAKPIQLTGDEDCAMRFRRVTAPFMMRRMKTDKTIIADLPEKIEQDDYATLKSEQAALYQKTLDDAMLEIEGMDTNNQQSLFKRQGLILQMILALKQICNHPAQFLKNGDQRADLSGKTEMLLDRIEAILDANEKVIVFTQFREMGDMLTDFIQQRTGQRPMFLHGGCTVKQRQQMIDRFQTDKNARVFILSLKAAGTGLNLTAASHVIHYDLWWNPAVEAQATDRAYRIGQKRNVVVHRFITQGTFEERINDMIQNKRHLADMTVASGENWIGKLSNKELHDIFG